MANASPRPGSLTRLAAEREQGLLWLPVGMIAGITLYFSLPVEPWAWGGLVAFVLLLAAGLVLRGRRLVAMACLAMATVALGFALAQWETWRAAAPLLEREVGPRPVTGRIVGVEPREGALRLVLAEVAIPRVPPEATPGRVRITVRTHGGIAPVPGAMVSVLAILRAPPGPAWPGGFDFGREAWFDGIGAVGFAVGPLTAAGEGPTPGLWRRLLAGVEDLRLAATERIYAALPGETGGVAAALLTGHRGGVPEPTLAAIRDAGLAHLLAISGLHLGMVAAIAFFVVRFALASSETLALRHPIKAWAAAAALVVAAGYLLISGMTVPTQRAFLMTMIVLVAVFFGRQAISLRLLALAAVIVLALAPHVALGASFQLSFAAVLALVAAWESLRDRVPGWRAADSHVGRLGLYLAGILVTTMIANAATAPFALGLFGRYAVWGPLANLLAVPLFAVWVMLWGLLALLLMPLGLEAVALVPMGWGIDGILAVARGTAALPWAHLGLPAPSPWALVCAGFGLMVLCLGRGRWRFAGIAGLVACALLFAAARPPDLLVTGEADLVALRTSEGTLAVSTLRRDGFTRDQWARMAGGLPEVAWPAPGEALPDGSLRCDSLGCLYRPPDAPDLTVAVTNDAAALPEDCAVAAFVLSLVPVRGDCPAPLGVIDRFDLWRNGTHAAWFDPGGARVESVAGLRGLRPWSPARDQ